MTELDTSTTIVTRVQAQHRRPYDTTSAIGHKAQMSHLKNNRCEISNITEKYRLQFEGGAYGYINGTSDVYQRYWPIIETYIFKYPIPLDEKYYYRPERFARDLYGSFDLWPLVLLVANVPTTTQFNVSRIKVIDPAYNDRIYSLLKKAKVTIKMEPTPIDDMILKEYFIR